MTMAINMLGQIQGETSNSEHPVWINNIREDLIMKIPGLQFSQLHEEDLKREDTNYKSVLTVISEQLNNMEDNIDLRSITPSYLRTLVNIVLEEVNGTSGVSEIIQGLKILLGEEVADSLYINTEINQFQEATIYYLKEESVSYDESTQRAA